MKKIIAVTVALSFVFGFGLIQDTNKIDTAKVTIQGCPGGGGGGGNCTG
jgi:hypothetical protein